MEIARLPVFAWFHFLWDPSLGWYAHRTEASDGVPEGQEVDSVVGGEPEVPVERSLDPEVALWYELFEEARTDGKPDMAVADPLVVEEIWQRQKAVASASAARGGINEIWSIPRMLMWAVRSLCYYRATSQEGEERYASQSHVLP